MVLLHMRTLLIHLYSSFSMHPQHVSSGTNIYQKLLILKCVHYAYILMKFSVGRHFEADLRLPRPRQIL